MSWGDFSIVLSPVAQEHNQDLAMVCEEENQTVWLVGSAHRGWKASLLALWKEYLYKEFLFSLCEWEDK